MEILRELYTFERSILKKWLEVMEVHREFTMIVLNKNSQSKRVPTVLAVAQTGKTAKLKKK